MILTKTISLFIISSFTLICHAQDSGISTAHIMVGKIDTTVDPLIYDIKSKGPRGEYIKKGLALYGDDLLFY